MARIEKWLCQTCKEPTEQTVTEYGRGSRGPVNERWTCCECGQALVVVGVFK